jgi:hypothetical protein
VRHHVDPSAQQGLQLLREPAELEQADVLGEVDQQVDITVGAVVAAGSAAEDSDTCAGMDSDEPQDLPAQPANASGLCLDHRQSSSAQTSWR